MKEKKTPGPFGAEEPGRETRGYARAKNIVDAEPEMCWVFLYLARRGLARHYREATKTGRMAEARPEGVRWNTLLLNDVGSLCRRTRRIAEKAHGRKITDALFKRAKKTVRRNPGLLYALGASSTNAIMRGPVVLRPSASELLDVLRNAEALFRGCHFSPHQYLFDQ